MGKLGCTCGYTIIDQTNNLAYKGDIIPDKEYLGLLDRLYDIIKSLNEANKTGEKEFWIKSHFQSLSYPGDLKDEEMINDLFTDYYIEVRRTIYHVKNVVEFGYKKDNRRVLSHSILIIMIGKIFCLNHQQ